MSDAHDGRPPVLVTSVMRHDVLNQLTIALGHADLLLLDLAPDDPIRSSVTEMQEACAKAARIIESWGS